jgi:DUF1365 family protein
VETRLLRAEHKQKNLVKLLLAVRESVVKLFLNTRVLGLAFHYVNIIWNGVRCHYGGATLHTLLYTDVSEVPGQNHKAMFSLNDILEQCTPSFFISRTP